jgi:hypothetical protein
MNDQTSAIADPREAIAIFNLIHRNLQIEGFLALCEDGQLGTLEQVRTILFGRGIVRTCKMQLISYLSALIKCPDVPSHIDLAIAALLEEWEMPPL